MLVKSASVQTVYSPSVSLLNNLSPCEPPSILPIILVSPEAIFSNQIGIIASPDAGGMERARGFAKKFGDLDLVVTDKRRPKPNVSEITNVIGNVKNKHVLLIDDMIDTGGTAAKSAAAIVKSGAKSVSMFCSHGVLSGKALDIISKSHIDELVITDTIKKQSKIKSVSYTHLTLPT